MKLTDKQVKKELAKINSITLNQRIRDLTEDAREERSDKEVFKTELEWAIEDFEDDGHQLFKDLKDARRILRETKYGRVIPFDLNTLMPIKEFSRRNIQYAKETVNEYNRLKRGWERLLKEVEEDEENIQSGKDD